MSGVTDADRERSVKLLNAWDATDFPLYRDLARAIAAALAEEREKARAPFLALAERLQEQADNWVGWADGANALLAFADQIDAAAEVRG